jgi:hypothetical protein
MDGHCFSRPARYWPSRPACSLGLSIFLKNIFHFRARPSCVATPELASTVFPAAQPVPRRAAPHPTLCPHPALRTLRCRTALLPRRTHSSSLCVAPPLLRALPRPPPAPRCRWGATDVAVHHLKVVAAVDVVAPVTRDLSMEML